MQRTRIFYAKTQAMRYTSNLDVHKVWERTFRRARLPLIYTQGFHPQPRLIEACPLPLGMFSKAEMIDAWLSEDIPIAEVRETLDHAIPPGLEIIDIQNIDPQETPLSNQVVSAEYLVTIPRTHSEAEMTAKINDIQQQTSLPRCRRGKEYDLRPLIEQLFLLPPEKDQSFVIFMRLAARQGANGRPDEVLSAMQMDPFSSEITRTRLVLIETTNKE